MKPPSKPALVLAAIPFLAITVTVPWWDRINPVLLGLPFNFFWLLVWIVATTALLAVAYQFERFR